MKENSGGTVGCFSIVAVFVVGFVSFFAKAPFFVGFYLSIISGIFVAVIMGLSLRNQRRREEEQRIEEKQRIAEEEQRRQKQRDFEEKQREEQHREKIKAINIINPERCEGRAVSDISEMPHMPTARVSKDADIDEYSDFIVIDVETTGLQPGRHEILEISMVRFEDFIPVEAMTTLVKPKKKNAISQKTIDINGITAEMVEDAPYVENVANEFVKFAGKHDFLVGHNIEFDVSFLYNNGIDVFKKRRKFFDTLAIAKTCLKRYNQYRDERDELYCDWDVFDYKLDTLCEHFDIIRDERHRALHDCIATGELFYRLVDIKTQ